MSEGPAYLKEKAGKNALGIHRGPLPHHDLTDDEAEAAFAHLEEAKGITLEKQQSTMSQKIGKHWKRFWCCYLLGNIIFLAIFLPIFFCICIPAIAQRVVDDSDLTLLNATILQPRPESVLMSVQSAIKLPIGVPVRINPLTLELLVRDMPGNNTYAKVYIPASRILGNTTVGEVDHPTPLNVPVWKEYTRRVMFNDHVYLSVHGSTRQHLGELNSMITMDKDVQLNGLGGFDGFKIEDSTLVLPPREDGTNLIANATLPNHSPFILEVGDKVIFDVQSGDLVIGNATIDNLLLKQGVHSYPLHGILDLKKMINNLGPILKEQRTSIRNGNLELKTVGKAVTYEGQHIDYYEEPLKSLVLMANVPIGDLLINTLQGMLTKNGTNVLSDEVNGGGDGGSSSSSSSSNSDSSGILKALSDSSNSDDSSDSSSSGGGLLNALKDAKADSDSGSDSSKRDLSDLLDKSDSPQQLLKDVLSRMDQGGNMDDFFADALQRLSKFV